MPRSRCRCCTGCAGPSCTGSGWCRPALGGRRWWRDAGRRRGMRREQERAMVRRVREGRAANAQHATARLNTAPHAPPRTLYWWKMHLFSSQQSAAASAASVAAATPRASVPADILLSRSVKGRGSEGRGGGGEKVRGRAGERATKRRRPRRQEVVGIKGGGVAAVLSVSSFGQSRPPHIRRSQSALPSRRHSRSERRRGLAQGRGARWRRRAT